MHYWKEAIWNVSKGARNAKDRSCCCSRLRLYRAIMKKVETLCIYIFPPRMESWGQPLAKSAKTPALPTLTASTFAGGSRREKSGRTFSCRRCTLHTYIHTDLQPKGYLQASRSFRQIPPIYIIIFRSILINLPFNINFSTVHGQISVPIMGHCSNW